MFFRFPPDARWNADRNVVECGIGVGEYEGMVRVSKRVFQILLPETPTPGRCLEAYHLHRTRLELIAERKVRRRHLTDDGNVEITGRDLTEREAPPAPRWIGYRRVRRASPRKPAEILECQGMLAFDAAFKEAISGMQQASTIRFRLVVAPIASQ